MTDVSLTLDQALSRAYSACRAGKFTEAEELCQRIMAARHDCFDAVNLLAFIQLRRGHAEVALATYERALYVRVLPPL
jgi:Flp pilus assembly protein TadD